MFGLVSPRTSTGHRNWPTHVSATRRVCVRPADLAAVGALAGYLALLPLPMVLRAVLVAAFVALGPGAAILTWVDIPVRARLAAVPVLGMSLTTITTMTAMWARLWNPTAILVLGATAVAAGSVLWYSRNSWPDPSTLARYRRTIVQPLSRNVFRRPAVVMVIAALLIWALSLGSIPGVDASTMGLLFSGSGPALAVAMVVCTVAFLIAVRGRQLGAAVAALAAAMVISRLTTTLATEVPLYDWAYKHIAVVDYILANGALQPGDTDIYAQWPAFFVVSAWFCDLTGMSAMTLAHVFAPVTHVLIALMVYGAARVLKFSRRTALVACFVVEITNWVGQDYFSPQAWALVLAYGLLMLLLASPTSRNAGILAIIPFAAMVPTHQLTPFWILFAAGLLVVIRRARPWWAVAVMVAIAGIYLVLHFDAVAPYGLLSGGSPFSNAASNVEAPGSFDKVVTSAVCRALSALVLASALASAFWQWRRGRPVLAPALLAFSSTALLLGQSYGGEAIFRVFVYGLLGCGLLIAPAVVNALDGFRGRSRRALGGLAAGGWMLLCAVAGLHAYTALWPMIVETRAQIDYMDQLTASIEPGTRLLMVQPGGLPSRLNTHYVDLVREDEYFDRPLSSDLGGQEAVFPTPEQLGALQWAAETSEFPTYVMFSTQSRTAVDYYQEYSADAIPRLMDFLRTTPGWTEVHRDGDTEVFFHPGAADGG
ncbi:MAG: hypothetical protein K0R68_2352 [Mycobacterium sp.]|nr:hypothetical protein [Mycobacterium sp.]